MAGKFGWMLAPVTQLLDLMLLAPDIQLAVLVFEAVDSAEPMASGPCLNQRILGVRWSRERVQRWGAGCEQVFIGTLDCHTLE